MNRFLQLILALAIGVLIGWKLHLYDAPPPALSLPQQQQTEVPMTPKVMAPPIPLVVPTMQPIPTPAPPDVIGLLNEGKIARALDLIVQQPVSEQQQARAMILHLARNLLHEHHADAAAVLLTPYQQRWPQDINARMLLSQAMLDLGQFQPAITLLNTTLQLTADQQQLSAIHHRLGLAIAGYDRSLRQQDQRNMLLDFYRQLSASDGSNVLYQRKQAELLIEMGQLTEASALLQPLLFGTPAATKAARQLQHTIDQTLAQSFTETIALTRLDNHFLVPLQLAGRTLMLLLDTGASLTLVPKSVANNFPLADKQKRITLATVNGKITVPMLMVPQLKLGTQVLHDISLALTDAIGIDGADGLLGMDILKRFHFVIDQEQATLRLTPRSLP